MAIVNRKEKCIWSLPSQITLNKRNLLKAKPQPPSIDNYENKDAGDYDDMVNQQAHPLSKSVELLSRGFYEPFQQSHFVHSSKSFLVNFDPPPSSKYVINSPLASITNRLSVKPVSKLNAQTPPAAASLSSPPPANVRQSLHHQKSNL